MTLMILTATIPAIVEAPIAAPIVNQRIPIIPTMAPPPMLNQPCLPLGVEPVLAPPIESIQPLFQQPLSLYSLHPIQPLPAPLPHVPPPRVTSYNDRKGKLNKNGKPYTIYYC